MKIKSLFTLIAVLLILAFAISSCDDDGDPVDTCTLELDKECYCGENPDDEACFVACEISASEGVYIKGDLTNNEFVKMEEGDLLDEYVIRIEVGATASFKFYNKDDGSDGIWGAAVGKSSDASGTVEAGISGSDCGNGFEDFDIENAGGKAFVIIKVNTTSGAYSVEFDDANPCVDLDLEKNKLWIKGGVAYYNEDDVLVVTWNGGVAGIPMEQTQDDPDVYSALIEHYPAWISWLDFKIVMNPDGDWGESAGEGGIALDFGPGVLLGDEKADPLEGVFFTKAFEVSFNSDGDKIETILDCTDAPSDPNKPDDDTPNTGGFRNYFPGGGEDMPEKQVPALITFNLKTKAYKVEFQ